MEYQPGTVIAQHYRLEAPIGFGGMGTVWRAHNELLDAPLALKLVRCDAHRSGSSARLFLEAKAAASLRHPAIVRVFDFGETENGDPFLAMELLEGESLRDLLEHRGRMPATQAVRLLLPILAGLGCAHVRGIVHRDLKPDNIFLARNDAGTVQPKVVDFGIAKFDSSSSCLTTAGAFLGSPSYMSPEQSLGDVDIDMRADLWAISVVLYETIAGRTPWDALNCPALLRAIVDDPPPSLVGVGGVDEALWAVIERGLAKRREDRWSSSGDLGRALALWLEKKGVVDDLSGASIETAWLSDHQSEAARASSESFPPMSMSPAVRDPMGAAIGEQVAYSHQEARASAHKRRRRITLGIGVSLAGCLMLVQVGLHTIRTPAASGWVVAIPPASASRPPPRIAALPEISNPMSAMGDVAPAAPLRTAERHSKVAPAHSAFSSVRPPIAEATPPPGSARAMDFGF